MKPSGKINIIRRWKRLNFRSKVLAIMLAVLVMVLSIGFIAYIRFRSVVTDITENAKPDLLLITTKSLMNDVYDAENHVKSFRLTEDTVYIYKFYNSYQNAQQKIHEIRNLNETGYHFQHLDSFIELLDEKFYVLDELLYATTLFRVEEALDKAVRNIKKATYEHTRQADTTDEGYLSWISLRKLFQSKNEQPDSGLPVDEVSKQLSRIKQEELNIESAIKQEEVRLIERDLNLSLKIKAIIADFEENEIEKLERNREKAEKVMRTTNIQIAVFIIAIGILLLLMTFIITNYIRHNNRYRKVLRRAKREAENLADAKEKFLANVSHEIRTPMHAIAGFTEQLANTELSEKQQEQVGIIRRSVDHLLYLVNDVLDLSKLHAGKLRLEKVAFRPAEAIEEVITLIEPLAGKKNISLISDTDIAGKQVLKGDAHRLKQILINLLTNALKFTNEGTVTLKARLTEADEKVQLHIEIADTGIGMSQKQVTRIFEEFEQADRSIARTFGGSGLGLSIVRKLVQLHRGTIHFDSTPGEGTVVTLDIPYQPGKAQDMETKVTDDTDPAGSGEIPIGLNALIVDDEEYNRKLLRVILKNLNIATAEAVNGKEAVKMVKREAFQLILMDTHMPEMNGIEATKAIRRLKDPQKNSIPVIALTADVSPDKKEQCFEAGMNGFLAKPFRESELATEIRRAFNPENEQPASEPVPEEQDDQLIDLTELKMLSEGKPEFYTDMLQTFIESMETGFNDLERTFSEGNWDMLAEYAHRMCSPVRHLSVSRVYRQLKKLEHTCRENKAPDPEEIMLLINNARTAYEEVKTIVKKELQENT